MINAIEDRWDSDADMDLLRDLTDGKCHSYIIIAERPDHSVSVKARGSVVQVMGLMTMLDDHVTGRFNAPGIQTGQSDEED